MGNKPAVITDVDAQRVCNSAGLVEANIKHLWKCFRQIDKRRNHKFSIDDFMVWLGIKRSIFYDKLFEIVGLDLDTCEREGIDWPKFVVFCVTYCAFGPTEILKFIFFLYDKEKNGCIDRLELQDMIREIHSDEMSSTEELALEMFQNTGLADSEKVQFKELVELNKNFPRVLYPAFVLQNTLASRSMGIAWWDNKRVELVSKRARKQAAGMSLCDKALENMERIRKQNIKKAIGRKRLLAFLWFGGKQTPERRLPRDGKSCIVMTDIRLVKQMIKKDADAANAKSKGQVERLAAQGEADTRKERSKHRRRRRSSLALEGADEFSHLVPEDGPDESAIVGEPQAQDTGSASGKKRRRRRSQDTQDGSSPSKPVNLSKVHPGVQSSDAVQAISIPSPGKNGGGAGTLQEV
jgi:Ca2+-binding EF-hand superfamily protein